MAVHIPAAAVACEACRTPGSRPATGASARASPPPRRRRHKHNDARHLRHRRRVHVRAPFPCTTTPMSMCTSGSATSQCCKHGSRQAWHRYLRLGFRLRTPRVCSVFETGLFRKREPLRNLRHAAALLVGRADRIALQSDHFGSGGETALAHRDPSNLVWRHAEIASDAGERLALPSACNDLTEHRVGDRAPLHGDLSVSRCRSGFRHDIGTPSATCKASIPAPAGGDRQSFPIRR